MSKTLAQKAAKRFVRGSLDYMHLVSDEGHFLLDDDTGVVEYFDDESEDNAYCGVEEFVGGVAYALALSGEISADQASPPMVARVCYEIGRVVGSGEVNG